MKRHNDIYDLLHRKIICPKCGKINRCYIDDPYLSIKCGACAANIDIDNSKVTETIMDGILVDSSGFVLPPRRLRLISRLTAEVMCLLVHGRFRSDRERKTEKYRFDAAFKTHLQLRDLRSHEISRKLELQRSAREAERLRADLESRRKYEQSQREQAFQMEQVRLQREAVAEFEHREQAKRVEVQRKQYAEFLHSRRPILLKALDELQYLTGRQFEILVGQIFESLGCKCIVTKCSGDQGVDVIVCSPENKQWAIQAKHYSGSVGNDAVQQVFSGMHFYKCDLGIVISTSGLFTSSACKLAKQLNIRLVGTNDLRRMLRDGDLI